MPLKLMGRLDFTDLRLNRQIVKGDHIRNGKRRKNKKPRNIISPPSRKRRVKRRDHGSI